MAAAVRPAAAGGCQGGDLGRKFAEENPLLVRGARTEKIPAPAAPLAAAVVGSGQVGERAVAPLPVRACGVAKISGFFSMLKKFRQWPSSARAAEAARRQIQAQSPGESEIA